MRSLPDKTYRYATRAVRRSNVFIRRLGRTLYNLLSRASLYRFTDDALLLSSSIAGLVGGLVIVAYHKVLELFEHGLHALAPEAWESFSWDNPVIPWTAFLLPVITALGGLLGALGGTLGHQNRFSSSLGCQNRIFKNHRKTFKNCKRQINSDQKESNSTQVVANLPFSGAAPPGRRRRRRNAIVPA